MNKLVVCIMGQNCEKFLPMCLESVKNADAIVYCDGGSEGEWWENILKVEEKTKPVIDIIQHFYNQENPKMNGQQRNFYLEHLKKNYPGWYALCLDADEVVEDLDKIKEWINQFGSILQNDYPAISVKMRHFIGDLGHEDAVTREHFVLNRLFYICDELIYPEVEHPVLVSKTRQQPEGWVCRPTTIWHLAYMPGMWEIKKRYENHLKKSNMHTPQFLRQWYYAHLFGKYPKSEIEVTDIPSVILNEFGIDKDEFYFANRNVEVKHFLMAGQYLDYCGMHYVEPTRRVLEFGCGKAPFGFAFKYLEAEYKGVELSKFAVDHAFTPIEQGDITTWKDSNKYDLCLVFDVLEHLKYEDLDKALENIKDKSDTYIFSIPFVGDPNLEADKTHIIKEEKEWWIEKISKYFNIEPTPDNFLFKEQIIVGKRK